MIDRALISVIGGSGGDGAVHGRREKFVPRGGPDGGDGGDGGSVHIRVDGNLNTLFPFSRKRRFAANNGANGASGLKHGESGMDVTIDVPPGTIIWGEGTTPRMMADLVSAGDAVTVAQGGRGGRGNGRFATSINRFPLLAEAGEPGQRLQLRLELKLLADVGVVGLPNAGKSSMLAAVSRAHPKIADYPFTTLEPNLGVVEWRRDSFVMVDIPGLIEGAHKGVGLGIDFLRHIERTDVLVHIVDGSVEDPMSSYRQINHELEEHDRKLMDRPQVVVLNKVDIPGVASRVAPMREELSSLGIPAHVCSVAARQGIEDVLDSVLHTLREIRSSRTAEDSGVDSGPELAVLRPQPRGRVHKVSQRDGVYTVGLSDAVRIAARVDMNNWNARMQFYDYLRRRGVVKALEQMGISSGDTVRFGAMEWEWE